MGMLLKYGWKEGEGLGRLSNGRTDCIQATRREMKMGLGAEKRKAEGDQWDNWWADCFNDVAKKLAVSNGGSTTGSSKAASDSDSDSTDDEGAGPQGGRVTAVKKAGVMKGKLRRVLRQEAPLQS